MKNSFYLYNLPKKEVTLSDIHTLVSSGELEELTEELKSSQSLKKIILPYITNEYNGFSNVIPVEIISTCDRINIDPEVVKKTIAKDQILNPSLIHLNPERNGLLTYIKIPDFEKEDPRLYYSAIAEFFASRYHLKVLYPTFEMSRRIYLSHDANAYFSDRCADTHNLLDYVPPSYWKELRSKQHQRSSSYSGVNL